MRRMVPSDDIILTQLRRGALEYCVLSKLAPTERYGRELAGELSADGVLLDGDGTLYPLLARLRRAGHVTTVWRESGSGPPRRYYALTTSGRETLDRFKSSWKVFRDAVDTALDESPGGRP